MSDTTQIKLSRYELDHLQRLRTSVVAFQQLIAPMEASERNNDFNHQFNQLRLQVQATLQTPNFEAQVRPAITKESLSERQNKILPRLYGAVIFGVILALTGLGLNYIIQNEPYTNTVGCCISTAGVFLVMAGFVVLTWRRPQTNLTELYQRCDALLNHLDHTLSLAIPDWANQSAAKQPPEVPLVVDLLLDSYNKQATDWQQKLYTLQEQKIRLEPTVPRNLTITIDFVEREVERVRQEIARLHGQPQMAVETDTPLPPPGTPPVKEITLPGGQKIALSKVDEESPTPARPTPKPATSDSPPPPPLPENQPTKTPPSTDEADKEEQADETKGATFVDTRKMKPQAASLDTMDSMKPVAPDDPEAHRAMTIGMEPEEKHKPEDKPNN